MRTRVFFIITTVIFLVTVISTATFSFIVHEEFIESIDRQLRALAVTLIAANVTDIQTTDIRRAEKIISDEIGAAKTGKFIIVRSADGEILFKDNTVDLFDLEEIPHGEQFITLEKNHHFVRVMTLKLSHIQGKFLQIGVVMPEELTPFYYSWHTITRIFFTLLLFGALSSLLLTSYLLKPLRDLGRFLAEASGSLDKKTLLPHVPSKLQDKVSPADEFFKLVADLDSLISKINHNYLAHRQWTSQMAHELKTPLSLMGLRIEGAFINQSFSNEERVLIEADMQKISGTINSFLDWAEVEYTENKRDLFACRLQKMVLAAVASLTEPSKGRIHVDIEPDVTFVCHPKHLEQLIDNLLINALKYAFPESPIHIVFKENSLNFINQGPPFPEEVKARLGDPFNKGSNSHKSGHGLGLAWVFSICKINNWELSIQSQGEQTICSVRFQNRAA